MDAKRSATFLILLSFAGIAAADSRPNILLIMADDLGYSDLGCYGGEIDTPNLDSLARDGLQFTQFYNTGRCWPTRASLLTGFYAQQVARDDLPGGKVGGRAIRPSWAPLVSVELAQRGYRCYHSGKWHLDGMPLGNGFHRSYYLRDQNRFFNPTSSYLDDVKLPTVKRESGFYATTSISEHALQMLRDHHTKHKDEPFFAYVAFTAPHFPLHALPGDIARNAARYRDGWDKARRARSDRIEQFGLVEAPLSPVEYNIGSPYPDLATAAQKIIGTEEVVLPRPWDQLTTEQQSFQARKMAVHAAMVDRMDREIGRFLAQLEKMAAVDNTFVLFLSDNGASAEIMVRGDGHERTAPMGSASSHLCLGPGWSTVSNTPFRRHKTWVHEGGISTPLLVRWPNGIEAAGELRRTPGHVIDVVPTLLDVTRQESDIDRALAGHPGFPGRSLGSLWERDQDLGRDFLWWFHEGNKAIRRGDWKLVQAHDESRWSLYNLKQDRTETRDLAAVKGAVARRMEAEWNQMAAETAKLVLESQPK